MTPPLERLGDAPWGAAVLLDGEAATTLHHIPEDGDVEIGSVTKGVTGLLYCDAVERGEVAPDDPLDRHLPLTGCAAGTVTLEALSQHRSGLPRLPAIDGLLGRSWRMWRHGQNPYGDTLAELLEQTRATKVGRPKASYSNLGFELLGHAVAAAAGTSYADLVRERVAGPLGLSSWYVPATAAELSPRAVPGHARGGRAAEAWTGEGLGPAGGIRSTVAGLATFAGALLDGKAPGSSALDPTTRFAGPAVRIGAAWITTEVRGRHLTWHNGGTGGWRSFVGLDREAGRAVAIVRAGPRSVDRVGMDLLRS